RTFTTARSTAHARAGHVDRDARNTAARLRPVERTVAHNGQQPAFCIATPVFSKGAERPKEGLLDDVVRGNRIARNEARQAVRRVQMGQEQILEPLPQGSLIRGALRPARTHGNKTARPKCLFPRGGGMRTVPALDRGVNPMTQTRE